MSFTGDALREVTPQQAATWLRANGWLLADSRPGHSATYRKPADDEGDYLVNLPLDSTFRDYARRMGEVVQTLMTVTGKSANWLLDEIRSSTVDIIRLRCTGPRVGQGRVPIDLGARLFGNARELLLAAACSAHDPRPVYRTRKPTEALNFLNRVKLAAPEEGSFVVTIHAPVPPSLQASLLEGTEDVPFERRSTLMLATASAAAKKAAEQAGLLGDAQPFLGGAAAGISANLCDALAGFVEGEGATALQMQFAWAASRPPPEGVPTLVQLDAGLSAVLQEGARLLRDIGSTPGFEVVGAVIRLERDVPGQGGVVVVAAEVDGQQRKIRIAMDKDEYELAIRAHRDGQLLRCEGELVRKGRLFSLERVGSVMTVEDDD